MKDLDTLVTTCVMIADDAQADVTRYEGKPFDGKTMAAYQGEQNAMIAALANVLQELILHIKIMGLS